MRVLGYLRLELLKLRRTKVWLIVFAMVAALVAWLVVGANATGEASPDGWQWMLFATPTLNAIIASLLSAVVASRIVEVDHAAGAMRQLLCAQELVSLLAAKLACCALVLGLALVLEVVGMLAVGLAFRFPGTPSTLELLGFAATQHVVCVAIAVIIMAVALRWENQFVSMGVGLTLSLTGLFSEFFSEWVRRLVPSGYYAQLSTMRMSWDGDVLIYYRVPLSWPDLALLLVVAAAVAVVSVRFLEKREV